MRYTRFGYTSTPWYQRAEFLFGGGIGLVILLIIGWCFMEFSHTYQVTGVLLEKNCTVGYSHDEREYNHKENRWEGDDETTAHRNYTFVVFSKGESVTLLVEKQSAHVNYLGGTAENDAFAKLPDEPANWTHAVKETAYIYTMCGWLFSGSLVKMEPMLENVD